MGSLRRWLERIDGNRNILEDDESNLSHFSSLSSDMNELDPTPSLIIIGDVLVQEDVVVARFSCDLAACRGTCCELGRFRVELRPGERASIENEISVIRGRAPSDTRSRIDSRTVVEELRDREFLGSFPDNRCVLSSRDDQGILSCQLERSYREGRTAFIKPLNCHLFPLSVREIGGTTVLRLIRHEKCEKGYRSGVGLVEFSREALTRAFGPIWYAELLGRLPELRRKPTMG